ncbi:hypothetical protein PIROE2DRAFT_16331 [Piromyces sp. E2]|nr:hypothetical protein PIROE2DRAFT_16331 [Piromyces sp. E2]|eukprot:OUM58402.1 hypothetical protein PIROE2DRAFT_16331 [Piromyces sp. E2]
MCGVLSNPVTNSNENLNNLNNILENEDTKKLILNVYKNILETMPVNNNKFSKRGSRSDLWHCCNYNCYNEPWYYVVACESYKWIAEANGQYPRKNCIRCDKL